MHAGEDFASVLRESIARSGMSLSNLRLRLAREGVRVSPSTLSHWQTGKRIPWGASSLDILEALERVLALPSGALEERVVRARRPGRPRTQATYSHFADTPPAVDDALAQLGLLGDYGLEELSAHVVVDTDSEGRVRSATNRQVFRATRDGARCLPAVLMDDQPFQVAPPITPVEGCRAGRRLDYPELGISVVEFVLDAPVPVNRIAVIETRLDFPENDPQAEEEFGYHLASRLKQCLMWIRFHPDCMPADAEAFVLSPDTVRTDIDVHLGSTNLQAAVHDFGPGRLYIRWYPFEAGG